MSLAPKMQDLVCVSELPPPLKMWDLVSVSEPGSKNAGLVLSELSLKTHDLSDFQGPKTGQASLVSLSQNAGLGLCFVALNLAKWDGFQAPPTTWELVSVPEPPPCLQDAGLGFSFRALNLVK